MQHETTPNYNQLALPELPEPFAWRTEDYDADRSATTYDPEVMRRWIAKGWPVWPLYSYGQVRENIRAATSAKDAEIAHERWLRERGEDRCVAVEDQIEALRAEVQRLQALTQWQPIGTAPKDWTRVLLLNDLRELGSDRVIVEAMWRTASQSAWWSCPVRGGYIGENPTHWMPLPEPQVGEK